MVIDLQHLKMTKIEKIGKNLVTPSLPNSRAHEPPSPPPPLPPLGGFDKHMIRMHNTSLHKVTMESLNPNFF